MHSATPNIWPPNITQEPHMKLNKQKNIYMLFINYFTKYFMSQISKRDDETLEVINQLKIVGLVVNSSSDWTDHVDYTVNRVNKILWPVIRLRQLRGPREKLITLYLLKVRSVLMFETVAFHSSLSKELSKRLQLKQKKSSCLGS